jgi:hypothetical protein
LHNKPKAEVHPEHLLTGPKEEEEGVHPASYTMDIGGKGTPVHEVDHTHSSSTEVKKEHVCLHGV